MTEDGGEIGRAQMLQARAARVAPTVHMNPVLLKPETETGAQVIVQGRRWATLNARDYGRRKSELLPAVRESFGRLERDFDIVLVEGAGSPAEINLRHGDIANMGFATAADVPVALVGDIDRGGVIAALIGTHVLLEDAERARVKAFIINRFRGDASLFDAGTAEIVRRTGWKALGIVPYFPEAGRLPAEDVLGLPAATKKAGARIRIAVPRLPRIANFDDLDPLRAEPDADVLIVESGQAIPGNCDLVLIPGSKATIADLRALRSSGWDIDIAAHVRRGGRVLGLCGGYQMLGRSNRRSRRCRRVGRIGSGTWLACRGHRPWWRQGHALHSARHAESGELVVGYRFTSGRARGRIARGRFSSSASVPTVRPRPTAWSAAPTHMGFL